MDEELAALNSRGTWELVPRPPSTSIVTCRWVFSVKHNPDGTVARHKARLVARGFTQTYGIDYSDTFSPVARMSSIRILFSIAINKNWSLRQLDVKNAFLYGDLTEAVFMEQPPGYVVQGEKMVCRLKKAIYGLKQSPREWFEKFSDIAKKGGFQRCTVDHSVFFRHTQTGGVVIMAVYVDDIILTGSDDQGIHAAQTFLQSHFVCRDMGRPRYFLGIEFAYRPQEVSLSQRKYVLDLLQETGQLGCKPESTPVELNPPYWDTSAPLLDDPTSYRRLVGKLIYLTVTRPIFPLQ